uniref:Uncharacterized protein n=1 Tax=Clytia hemisphaerica TaxID=252671 RepID=A0A7M5XEI3_9CNID|eukprot:TCONS_00059223-protein
MVTQRVKCTSEEELQYCVRLPNVQTFLKQILNGEIETQRSNLFNKGTRVDLQCQSYGAFTERQVDVIQKEIEKSIYHDVPFWTQYFRLPFLLEVILPECLEIIVAEICENVSRDQASFYFKNYR